MCPAQSQTETEQGWSGRNRRRHEEAVGGGPQNRETRNEDATSEEEIVSCTEGRIAGEFGKSTSGQGCKAGGESVIEQPEHLSNQRLPVALRCWFGRGGFHAGEQAVVPGEW